MQELMIKLAQINHTQHQLECIKVMLEIFQMIHSQKFPSGTHQQELDLLRQNSEIQESQSSFGKGQRVKKLSSKGRE